jgi:hypothetical protein
MIDEGGRDAQSPAEERLVRYLEDLREHPPQPDEALVGAVLTAARWQAAVRPYLGGVGLIAGAFAEGARILIGGRQRR